jgi:hypothetical protein
MRKSFCALETTVAITRERAMKVSSVDVTVSFGRMIRCPFTLCGTMIATQFPAVLQRRAEIADV